MCSITWMREEVVCVGVWLCEEREGWGVERRIKAGNPLDVVGCQNVFSIQVH